MRQIKNCKVGHFVKYNGVVCQVNCFFTNWRGKQCTLVQVGDPGESRRMFFPDATEKVEYLGPVARENGRTWIAIRTDRDPFDTI